MSKSYKKDSASSRKRKLSDGNDAVGQTISKDTAPTGSKRLKRSGRGVPDGQGGSKEVEDTPSMALDDLGSTHSVGGGYSLTLISDPLRVTASQKKNVLQATCAIAIDALKIVKGVAEAVPVAGNPLKATCSVIIDVLEMIRESDAAHEGWKELVQTIADASDVAGRVLKWSKDHPEWHQNVRDQVIKYMRKLDEIRYELADHTHDPIDRIRGLKSLWHNLKYAAKEAAIRKIGDDKIRGFKEDLNVIRLDLANVLALQTAATTSQIAATTSEIAHNVQHLHSKLNDQDVDALLRSITSAAMANGDIHQTCTKGTRGFILDEIRRWVDDNAAPQIFLLIDAAGYGKSTIAKQMATELMADRRLLGRFFFSRSAEETRTTKFFFSTIAQQGICQFDPTLRSTVAVGIKELINPVSAMHEEQFQRLFFTPLEDMKRNGVLILDALDECEASLWDSTQSPLSLILGSLPNIPNLKVFITSRPEADLVLSLMNSRHAHQVISSTSNIQNNKDDIETFLTSTLQSQLKRDDIVALVKQADGLFIWASTAAKILRRHGLPQQEKLRILLNPRYKELDALYKDVMETAFSEYEKESAMKILEIIAIAAEPLSSSSIDQLLEHPGSFSLIQRMASVLLCENPGDPIRFLHPTFLEFLLQSSQSREFSINSRSAHHSMTKCTLRMLHKELKYDICQIISPGIPLPMNEDIPHLDELIEKRISTPLRYSALHWISHAVNVLESNDVWKDMIGFFRSKLLNWIEIAGLMDSLVPCIAGIGRLLDLIRNRAEDTAPRGMQWTEDILDFLRTNQTLLCISTMHVYTSALMWLPLSSPIRNQYLTADSSSHIPQIKIGLDLDLPPANRLVGHIGSIKNIIPHPSGQYIISLSCDWESDLQLIQWDIKTCTKVWEKRWRIPNNGYTYTQLVYSSDKTHVLVGCSWGMMIYLKLENMGLKEIWANYSLRPTVLAILPTGDQAIYLYKTDPKDLPAAQAVTRIGTLNLISQEIIPCVVLGKDQDILTICVCEIKPFFATVSFERYAGYDITAWNITTNTAPAHCYSWRSKQSAITFLPQSTKLLSMSGDHKFEDHWTIWDVETGEQVFSGSHTPGRLRCPSDSNQLVLLGKSSIFFINPHNLEETQRSINVGYASGFCWVESQRTLFWDDGNQIKMSKIEDEGQQDLHVHQDPVCLLSFMNNGRMLLTATEYSVEIWSTDSWEMLKSVDIDRIQSVACSLGSSHIIIVEYGGRTQIWEISHHDQVSREFDLQKNDLSNLSMLTGNHTKGIHWVTLHPSSGIFAICCTCVDSTLQFTLDKLKPDGTLSPRKIYVAESDSDYSKMSLSFHPDGRYLCWNENALDISVDPPVVVDAVDLPEVLAETFETTSTLVRYREGDYGIRWIDFGVPPRHSFALPLDFALSHYGLLAEYGYPTGKCIAFDDNFVALGGQDGRVIAMDFSNLVEETDLDGPFWHYEFDAEKLEHLFIESTSSGESSDVEENSDG